MAGRQQGLCCGQWDMVGGQLGGDCHHWDVTEFGSEDARVHKGEAVAGKGNLGF